MHIELSIHSTPKICWQSSGKYITMFPSSFLRVTLLLLLLIYSPLLIIQSGYSQLYFTNEISMERKQPAHEIGHRVGWLMSLGCAAFWGRKALIDVNENTFFTFPVISFVIMSLSSSLWLMLEKQLVLHTIVRCSL